MAAATWRDLTVSPLPRRRCQVLILSPTRELACQTEKVILAVGDYMNAQAHACIGGKSVGEARGGVGPTSAQHSGPCPVDGAPS